MNTTNTSNGCTNRLLRNGSTPATRHILFALTALAMNLTTPNAPAQGTRTNAANGASQATPSGVLPPQTNSTASSSAGVHFFKSKWNIEPNFVGYGFDFDPTDGEMEIKQPVFTVGGCNELGDDSSYEGFAMQFQNFVTSEESFSASSLSLSLSGSIGMVKLGASFSNSTSSETSSLEIGVGLEREDRWAPMLVDLTSTANYTLTTLAAETLAITDPLLRAQVWRQNFGRFVGVGYDIVGRVGLHAKLTDFSSYKAQKSNLAFSGSYGHVQGQADFASFASQALSSQGVELDLIYDGDIPFNPHIPTSPDELDTVDERTAFVNSMLLHAAQAKIREGIYLLPAQAFPGAPLITPFGLEPVVIAEAGREAQLALVQIQKAYHYNYPVSLREFLDARFPAGGGQSFSDELDQKRISLLLAFDALWLALQEYMTGDNSLNPVYRAALVERTQEVASMRLALEAAIYQIFTIGQTLPPMSVAVYENYDMVGNCNAAWRGPWRIVIDNAAAFTDGTYAGIYDWLHYRSGSEASYVLREDRWCASQFNVPHYLDNPTENVSVVSHSVHPSGPNAGLSRIEFTYQENVGQYSREYRAEVLDDFARTAQGSVDIMLGNWPF